MQSVTITTDVVSSNPVHGKVYSITTTYAISAYHTDVVSSNLDQGEVIVPITTYVVISNLDQGEVLNLCDKGLSVTCDRSVVFSGSYVIKFVSDLRQVGGFLQVYSM